ncbi:hypothetical protein [Acinetobacter sp. YH12251]|uniref:hypothetical protein n=1 Tax=Acinetobacter sp. YH12251 TaxID=2601176 RepID=UPI0015D0E426|nr:hypothetical protein [Acinetobacter sp. YH12251]
MPKVLSIIPKLKESERGAHSVHGTQVLLDDGSRLEGVTKVTLVAEVGNVWKAIIEVNPINQLQIDAQLSELKVNETPKTSNQTAGDDTQAAKA